MKVTTNGTALVGVLALGARAQEDVPINCVSGLRLITARGSDEPSGFGALAPVKDSILARVPQSDASWLAYPATLENPPYEQSQPMGVRMISDLITSYADACPGNLALLGYSQGAQVVGDALIGGDYEALPPFVNGSGLEQRYVDRVVAVVMMGDPANVAGQEILVGNSTRSGFFPRNNTENWATKNLVGKVQSYCDGEDIVCDSGSSFEVHASYVQRYGQQAADYVVERAQSSTENNTNGPTDVNATSTGPPAIQPTNSGNLVERYSGGVLVLAIGSALLSAL